MLRCNIRSNIKINNLVWRVLNGCIISINIFLEPAKNELSIPVYKDDEVWN